MKKTLNNNFFNRKTAVVAKELLGKFLVRKIGDEMIAEMITETEAYVGPQDLASHSSKGRTKRTEIMYGKPGTIYIYLIYGMYWMLNVVTEEKDYPAAVLLRGTTNSKGPGKLTKTLSIDKSFNGKMLGKKAGLWIEDRGINFSPKKIKAGPRIGIAYAGEIWANKKYRFVLNHSLLKRGSNCA